MKISPALKNWQLLQRVQLAALLILIIIHCLVGKKEVGILEITSIALVASLLIQGVVFALRPELFHNKKR